MAFRSALLGLAVLAQQSTVSALVAHPEGTYQQFSAAAYGLVDSYTSSNFFADFGFFTGADPTHGYVNYLSGSAAQSAGLTNANNNQIYLGVDHTTTNPSAGRASVRLTSNKSYTHGLFIADIAHMPGSICGGKPI